MSALQDKYVNPLTDFGFKKLFGTEPNKDLLIDFLNQILPAKHTIKTLSYSRNEHLGHRELDRKAIFDLYCIGATGERFIVEIQKAKQNFFKDRSIYYASFPIQEQAKKGEWDYQLDAIYTVGILDFIFEDHRNNQEFLHLIELKNQRCEVFYEKLKFIYVELPKFTKKEQELESQFDKWLYVFRHLSALNNRPKALQEKIFKKLFAAAEIARFSPEEKEAYENSLKYYRDLKNVVDTSFGEGMAQGIQQGIEEGIAKGIEQGIAKGIEQGEIKKQMEIAKNLKSNGLDAQFISNVTGLSIERIKQL